MDALVRHQLYTQVEGTCTGLHGYLIAVLSIDRIDPAYIQEGTGSACFPVLYTALLLKPFKNEVLFATVSGVNKMGFFAMAGPLQVFVSSHLVPADWMFDAVALPPCYRAKDDKSDGNHDVDSGGLERRKKRVGQGDLVKLKIVGTKVDATEIVAIGSIKEDYLGVV